MDNHFKSPIIIYGALSLLKMPKNKIKMASLSTLTYKLY